MSKQIDFWRIEKTDCLIGLKKLKDSSVDLIYLDPPFFTQKKHILKTRDGQKTFQFTDSWNSRTDYINYLSLRLKECRRVLKITGSLFFHCDVTASHHIKILLDEIFGEKQFRSEIIWSYKRWSNSKKGLLNQHQNIFFYSKSEKFKFNDLRTDYSPTTNVDQIVQKRTKDNRLKSVYQKDLQGQVVLATSKKGVPLGDVWEIPFLNPKAKERVSYPTQKPILLLEKIIQLVTVKGDTVVDPFCGSGTTLVAAHLLQRYSIGFDINQQAVQLAKSRMKSPFKTESHLLKKGIQNYIQQDHNITEIIKSLGATPVMRNKGIDGLMGLNHQIIPIKVVRKAEDLNFDQEKLLKAITKNKYSCCGLYFPFVLTKKVKSQMLKQKKVVLFKTKEELENKVKMLSQSD